MNTLSLKEEMASVAWLQKNQAEVRLLKRATIAERLHADTGITVKPAQLARLAKAGDVELLLGTARLGNVEDGHSRDACLARILRRIGRELNSLSQQDEDELTTIIARRTPGLASPDNSGE